MRSNVTPLWPRAVPNVRPLYCGPVMLRQPMAEPIESEPEGWRLFWRAYHLVLGAGLGGLVVSATGWLLVWLAVRTLP